MILYYQIEIKCCLLNLFFCRANIPPFDSTQLALVNLRLPMQGRSQGGGGVRGVRRNPPLGCTNIADGDITTTEVSQEEFSQNHYYHRDIEFILLLESLYSGL